MIYLTKSRKTILFLFFLLLIGLNAGSSEAAGNGGGRDSDGLKRGDPLLTPGKKGIEKLGGVKGNLVQGQAIYTAKCVYCHGKKGLGNGMAAMALQPKPANYVALKTYLKTDQQLFETVTYGRKGSYQLDMPAWGPVMTKQERADVISYVKKLAKSGKESSEK